MTKSCAHRLFIVLLTIAVTSCAQAPKSERATEPFSLGLRNFDYVPLPSESVQIGPGVQLNFVQLPPALFHMGSPPDEIGRWENEDLHRVFISREFDIQDSEVTQEQWHAVMGNNPSKFKSKEFCNDSYVEKNSVPLCPGNPVESVSWIDIQEFLLKINQLNKAHVFRLPTEAEWEYAARAGSRAAYSFGKSPSELGKFAWFESNSLGQTQAVRKKLPNKFGLYDVHGNVWEWVQDWFAPYIGSSTKDPNGPPSGSSRIIRGGSFGHSSEGARSANRGLASPDVRSSGVGFRLVKERHTNLINDSKPAKVTAQKRGTFLLVKQGASSIEVPFSVFLSRLKWATKASIDYNEEFRNKLLTLFGGTRVQAIGEVEQTAALNRLGMLLTAYRPASHLKFKRQMEKLRKQKFQLELIGQTNLLITQAIDEIYSRNAMEVGKTDFEVRLLKRMPQRAQLSAEFIRLPAGNFKMGSPDNEYDRDANETYRSVTVPIGFEIQQTEVTQHQWFQVMGYNPSEFKQREHCPEDFLILESVSLCSQHPVESISWEEAQDFIARLNRSGSNYHYRLPTEIEWEYAARAGTTTSYSFGELLGDSAVESHAILNSHAWYFANSGGKPHPVRMKRANPNGLYDIHGNVWEWIQDWYGTENRLRSLRGGGWISLSKNLRSANRGNAAPASRAGFIGLRLIRIPKSDESNSR